MGLLRRAARSNYMERELMETGLAGLTLRSLLCVIVEALSLAFVPA